MHLKSIQYIFIFYAVLMLVAIPGFGQEKPEPSVAAADSSKTKEPKTVLEENIDYSATDSIITANFEKKVYLHGDAKVIYGDIELTAAYIEYDFNESNVFARGVRDSVGDLIGQPQFKEGNDIWECEELTYNLKTRKGLIKGVVREEGEGFLHSQVAKKQENGSIHTAMTKYTTCDLEDPHFHIALTKAIIKPNDKIVSGPLYVVIEGVPLPIGLPFGYFPVTKKYASGIIIPSYGEEKQRGFYLRQGGYYFAINDYVDLALRGEIYSKGSWGVNAMSRYKKMYKYNGNVNIQYSTLVAQREGNSTFKSPRSMSIKWNHSQDAKANPTRSFSASVNFSTNSHDKYNATSHEQLLNTQKSSNITYRKKWPGSPFNLTANMSASQNTKTNSVNLKLPVVALSMNRLYPLKRKNAIDKPRWYEKLTVGFSANMENGIQTSDTTLFNGTSLRDFKSGYKHDIPISLPIKISKWMQLSPSLSYSGVLATKYKEKKWGKKTTIIDGEEFLTDTVIEQMEYSPKYLHQYSTSVSLSANPKFYGTYTMKPDWLKNRINAVRHVLSPSVSINYKPGIGVDESQYLSSVQTDTLGNTEEYNIIEGLSPYGISGTSKESGSIGFSLDNLFEMKYKGKNDTAFQKIKLLDRLTFRTSYNLFADSMNWSKISFSTGTRLFKNLNMNFSASFDPYAKNGNGRRINQFELSENMRLARFENARLTTSISFKSKTDKNGNKIKHQTPRYYDPYYGIPYTDFNVPWDISFSYSLNLNNNFNKLKKEDELDFKQTLTFNGGIRLTDKWKISYRSGYDFNMTKFTSTSLSIHRDLHCWSMDFSWIPFGTIQSYSFRIFINSSVFDGVEYKIQDSQRKYNY